MAKRKPASKKKWLQSASKQMKKKGTVGSFTAYCKSKGFKGVTSECIAMGMRSKDPGIRKKANFARNAGRVARARKKSK